MYVPVMEHAVSINAELNMAETGTNFNVKNCGMADMGYRMRFRRLKPVRRYGKRENNSNFSYITQLSKIDYYICLKSRPK